jgi:hypothetical protein
VEVGGRRILDPGFPVLRSRSSILLEQLAGRAYRLFDLPQRGPAIEAERIQRADFRERGDFVAS